MTRKFFGRFVPAGALSALLIAACILPYGCGPTFPIMTAEQEARFEASEKLPDEIKALKTRVAAIEEGRAGGGGNLDEVKATVADTALGLDQLRQEFSFIRGNIEESEFERAQIKEDIKFSTESLKSFNERVSAMESALADSAAGLAEISATVEANSKEVAALRETVKTLEGRISALEAGAPAAAPGPPSRTGADAGEDPEEIYKRGYQLTREKKFAEAAETFQGFLKDHPKHKLADHAQYWLGEIYYATGEYEKAILEFDSVIKKYPKGSKVPAAMLKQGYSFEKAGFLKEARVLLERVVSEYPGTDEAALAQKRLETLKKKIKTSE